MESPQSIATASQPEVVLEGSLLKQGARSRHSWRDRYFVFRADNTLRYYHKKGAKPKAVYDISNQCEVSDLYVEKHNKKLIYCVRLTFSTPIDNTSVNNTVDEQQIVRDDSSSFAGGILDITLDEAPQSPNSQTSIFRTSSHPVTGGSMQRSPARRMLKRSVSEGRKSKSADNESLSFSTDVKRKIFGDANNNIVESATPAKLEIPSLVEVERRHSPQAAQRRTVGDEMIMTDPCSSSRKKTPYEKQRDEEQQYLKAQYLTERKQSKKKSRKNLMQGTKLAVAAGATAGLAVATAGIGLAVGLVFIGAAVAGGGSAALANSLIGQKSEGELVIASADYELIKRWKSCFDAAIKSSIVQRSTWGQLFGGKKTRLAIMPKSREGSSKTTSPNKSPKRAPLFEGASKWTPMDGGWAAFLGTGVQSLRIFREAHDNAPKEDVVADLSVAGKPCAPVKAHVVLSTSALDAFLCLMSYGCATSSIDEVPMPDAEHGSCFRIIEIETVDDNTDIIHLVTRPLFLFPLWTTPRDYVLYRYWRLEPDGSYVICYESMEHEECPPLPDYVRGEMHQVFTIAPHKKNPRSRADVAVPNECLMTAVVQVDPRGWVPTMPMSFLSNQSYGDAFGVAALLQLLEIRGAIDLDRFVPVSLGDSSLVNQISGGIARVRSADSAEETVANEDFLNYDFTYSSRELKVSQTMPGLATMPPPLRMEKWAVPDSNSFRVRGKYYMEDKKKHNAGPSIGRLIAVDVVRVDKPIYSGISMHPAERVQLALKREAFLKAKGRESDFPAFLFVVNIVLPGPPVYHGVFYYAIDDMSKIDGTDGTPSSKLCNEFFFGDSDEFRDQTFKLIPQIVQGNFIVRKAVGSTPALIGKKLRQLYVRNNRFFEVIMDCGSSSVATGVIRLSLGYARTMVIDLAFLLEGNDETTLPERIFGSARIKKLQFGPQLRHVESPPDEE